MNDLYKKAASVIAAGALLATTAFPAIAGTTVIEISGNGANTDNDGNVTVTTTTTVVQSNSADIENDVDIVGITGANRANDNVGGSVEIDTGDVDASVGISNTANSNYADVNGCCDQNADVLISGNARGSDNTVRLETGTATNVFQDNEADVDNDVDVKGLTGANKAKDNIGGDVLIETGDVDVDSVMIINTLNNNSARVGGQGGTRTVSARIVGNGRKSDNDINLKLARSILLTQGNEADVDTDVDVIGMTGKNRAKDNVGGNVEIDTGDVDAKILVDTLANFNTAAVECECTGDVWAKIADNVRDSDNDIKATLSSDLSVFQDNACDNGWNWPMPRLLGEWWPKPDRGDGCLDTDVGVNGRTGANYANGNGGDVLSDPLIETGDVDAEVEIYNSGNSNMYGSAMSMPWDDMFPMNGFNLNISLSLTDLLMGLLG